jgi:hypothetical protein
MPVCTENFVRVRFLVCRAADQHFFADEYVVSNFPLQGLHECFQERLVEILHGIIETRGESLCGHAIKGRGHPQIFDVRLNSLFCKG